MGQFNNGGGGTSVADAMIFGTDPLKNSGTRYFTNPHVYTEVAKVLIADTIYYLPFQVPAATYTRIGLEVETSVASSTARIGIYEVDATTGGPGTLTLDAGTVDTSSTGVKEITISQAMTVAPFYVAVICDGGITIKGDSDTVYPAFFGRNSFDETTSASHLAKPTQSAEHTSLSSTALSSLAGYIADTLRVSFRVV